MEILEQRLERFKSVIGKRQFDLTIVLENVHDPHNIGAVLRSADSVGINEVYIIYTDPRLQKRGLDIGLKSASGAKQWIAINYFEDVTKCLTAVKSKYNNLYGTKLDTDAKNLYDLNMASSCALVFGNEHKGLSEEVSSLLDANFIIPQHGFVKSLNISVACAVTLYEAQRQRLSKGFYNQDYSNESIQKELFEKYKDIHIQKKLPKH